MKILAPFILATLLMPSALVAQVPAPQASMATGSGEEPLGRLFFSPERRSAMERQRQYNIKESQAMEGETLSLDGVVLRSSGKKTYWVNGRAQNDDSNSSGVAISSNRKNPGQARVTSNGEPMADLRIGETLNLSTKEKQTGIGNGTVTVKPRP